MLPGSYTVTVTDGGGPPLAGLTLITGPQSSTNPTTTINVSAGDVFLNADFGYKPDTAIYKMGDYVWLDANRDGNQDTGEQGIDGVTVALLDNAGNVIATTMTGDNPATTGTVEKGWYEFTGLDNGTYTVWVNDTNGRLTAMTRPTIGTTDWTLSYAAQEHADHLGADRMTRTLATPRATMGPIR